MNSNKTDFLSRSNYLVGFLAALIGMAAFKEELSQIYITLFGVSFSLLISAFPMIVGILLATYLGALAHFTSNITITKFALSKYLSLLSNTIAILSLGYPIILSLLLTVSWVLDYTQIDTQLVEDIFLIVMSSSSVVASLFAFMVSRSLRKVRIQNNKVELLQKLHEVHERIKEVDGYEFLRQYEELVNYAVSYLKLQGYGFGGRNLVSVIRVLADKEVLSQEDVQRANELSVLRNGYAHGQKDLKLSQLKNAIRNIERLKVKIEKALYDNFDDANSK